MKYIFFTLFVMMMAVSGGSHAADVTTKPAAQKAPEIAPTLPREKIKIISAGQQRAVIDAELAINPRDQERGLMGRTKIAKNSGMLFILSEDRFSYFWMKNTLVALDLIFIDRDGRIVKIHERAQPKDETIISSGFPVRAVLEIPAGQVKKRRLQMGDLVVSAALDQAVAAGSDAP